MNFRRELLEYFAILIYNKRMFCFIKDLRAKTPARNQKINDFLYSPYFLAYACLIALISYVAEFPFAGLAIFAAVACYLFLTGEDVTPVIPLLLLAIIQLRDVNDMTHPVSIAIFLIAAVFLILHLILYPVKKFLKLKLTVPLLILTFSLFVGGLFSPYLENYMRSALFAFAIGPVVLIIYLFFANYVRPPEHVNLKKYFCLVLTFVGIVAVIQIILHKLYFFKVLRDFFPNQSDIGWANVNSVAACLLFSIAACSYLLSQTDHLIKHTIVLLILFGGLFYTLSDGSIGAALVFAPIAMYYTLKRQKTKNKRKLLNIYCAVLALVVISACVAAHIIGFDKCIKFLFDSITSDHGRTNLFTEALNHFINYPIFGIGMAYVNPDSALVTNVVISYNFHSIIFQALATTGIVGTIAYAIYYIARFKILTANNGSFNIFMYIGFATFTAYAAIDTCENTVVPCMIFATLCMVIVEITNSTNEPCLPLKNKKCYKDF